MSTVLVESGWGGSEELWSRTARLALDRGHQVTVVTYRRPHIPPGIRELCDRGARLLRIDWHGIRPRVGALPWRLRWLSERLRVWDALAALGPDVVCVSHGSFMDPVHHWPFPYFVNKYKFDTILLFQHCWEEIQMRGDGAMRRTALDYLAQARSVVFVAEGNLRYVERELAAGVPNARVVQNPVNLVGLQPVPYPRSDVAAMATVARLEPHAKGQDVLFEALGGEAWSRRPWRLRLYGSGPGRSYLEELAGHYGIVDRVEFRGHVPDVRSIWAENQLLVMPSRSEGTPLALVEAMICARPSLVTDVGGNLEWVEEPAVGFIAEAPSARSLGAALERAWDARDNWETIGRRAHEVAVSRIDPHPDETLLSLLLQAREPVAHEPAPSPPATTPR